MVGKLLREKSNHCIIPSVVYFMVSLWNDIEFDLKPIM